MKRSHKGLGVAVSGTLMTVLALQVLPTQAVHPDALECYREVVSYQEDQKYEAYSRYYESLIEAHDSYRDGAISAWEIADDKERASYIKGVRAEYTQWTKEAKKSFNDHIKEIKQIVKNELKECKAGEKAILSEERQREKELREQERGQATRYNTDACIDSEGKDYFTRGSVTIPNHPSEYDVCDIVEGREVLVEIICAKDDEGRPTWDHVFVECENGCVNGACRR